jgi:hypothetical protein
MKIKIMDQLIHCLVITLTIITQFVIIQSGMAKSPLDVDQPFKSAVRSKCKSNFKSWRSSSIEQNELRCGS